MSNQIVVPIQFETVDCGEGVTFQLDNTIGDDKGHVLFFSFHDQTKSVVSETGFYSHPFLVEGREMPTREDVMKIFEARKAEFAKLQRASVRKNTRLSKKLGLCAPEGSLTTEPIVDETDKLPSEKPVELIEKRTRKAKKQADPGAQRKVVTAKWFAQFDAEAAARGDNMVVDSLLYPDGYSPDATPTPMWKVKAPSRLAFDPLIQAAGDLSFVQFYERKMTGGLPSCIAKVIEVRDKWSQPGYASFEADVVYLNGAQATFCVEGAPRDGKGGVYSWDHLVGTPMSWDAKQEKWVDHEEAAELDGSSDRISPSEVAQIANAFNTVQLQVTESDTCPKSEAELDAEALAKLDAGRFEVPVAEQVPLSEPDAYSPVCYSEAVALAAAQVVEQLKAVNTKPEPTVQVIEHPVLLKIKSWSPATKAYKVTGQIRYLMANEAPGAQQGFYWHGNTGDCPTELLP